MTSTLIVGTAVNGAQAVARQTTAGSPANASHAPAAAPNSPAGTEFVLVDANADGDTPVRNGKVRLHACGDGSSTSAANRNPLVQVDGDRVERTGRNGIALIAVDDLPSCFVTRISDGRVAGRPLRGSLVAQGRNHPDSLLSISASPASTLRFQLRSQDPRMTLTEANRKAQRLLRIPSRYTDLELAADDSRFDGDRYMRRAQSAGSVNRFNRRLIAADEPRRFRADESDDRTPRNSMAATGVGDDIKEWWKELNVKKMVGGALADFGASLALEGGKWILGKLLDQWGLKEVKDWLFPKPDTQKIIEMIEGLTVTVNDIQRTSDNILNELLDQKYEEAVKPAKVLINQIDTIEFDIKSMVKLGPDHPDRVDIANRIADKIGKIEGDRFLINSLMTQGVGGRGILVAASKKAASHRFFTNEDSRSVKAVYEYFAIYQLRLANLMVEFWNHNSCRNVPKPVNCSSPEISKQNVDKYSSDIAAQESLLKPVLPEGRFVDTKTNSMWDARPAWITGARYQPKETCRFNRAGQEICTVDPNWVNPGQGLATTEDFQLLIEGTRGDSPLDWLVKSADLRLSSPGSTPKDQLGFAWVGPEPVSRTRFGGIGSYQTITRANLASSQRPGPDVVTNNLRSKDPQAYWGYAFAKPDKVTSGTYWWPIG